MKLQVSQAISQLIISANRCRVSPKSDQKLKNARLSKTKPLVLPNQGAFKSQIRSQFLSCLQSTATEIPFRPMVGKPFSFASCTIFPLLSLI
jgi:hypothetical protein